jgi:predicted pyridoxine 5'-phosphate oxidase superfamily flavin-nucleotide-binding protein
VALSPAACNRAINPDELTAQTLAGGGPRGASGIRNSIVAATDAVGWPVATLLTGKPGFVQSADPETLYVAALPDVGDPAADALQPDRSVGILGIDFSTRRRNRANGRILSRNAHGIRVTIDQSFGNCPQYIQLRTLKLDRRAEMDR